MKVALLKGESQYGVLRLMIDDMACAFQRRGWDVIMVDLEAMQNLTLAGLVQHLIAGGPLDLIISINFGGNFIDQQGRALIDLVGAPHVVQYVDYPLQDVNRLTSFARSTALLLVDPSHVDAVKELLGPDRFAYVGFSPHAALGNPKQIPSSPEGFAAERSIPILFAGTYCRPRSDVWDRYPLHFRKVLERAVDIATSTEWISPLDALDKSLLEHGLNPKGGGGVKREDMLSVRLLAAQVHDTVRWYRRDLFLKAAARAGLPLTVVGNGYDEVAGLFGNIDYRGSASVDETLRMMQNARLSISLTVNFGRGSHERALTAMVAGSAVASDFSTFYADAFASGREMSLFRWSHLEEDLATLADLAANPKALFEMAGAGQTKAMAEHRWDSRLDTIIQAGNAAKALYGHGASHPR